MNWRSHLLQAGIICLLLGFTLPCLLGAASPREGKADWDNLKQLAPDQQIQIVLSDAKSYRGMFQGVRDDALVVRLTTGQQTFARDTILRVSTRGRSHAGRNALMGAALGTAAGAALIAGLCQSTECKGPVEAIVGVTVGAPLGALVGFVTPTGGWHDVYRAR